MTGRQYLNMQVSVMAIVLTITLVAWFIFIGHLDSGQDIWPVIAIPVGGILFCVFYHLFLIRCPRCGASIGYVTRSLIDFSLFRFSKRVRFCPHCKVDFEDDLAKKR